MNELPINIVATDPDDYIITTGPETTYLNDSPLTVSFDGPFSHDPILVGTTVADVLGLH